MFFCIYLAVCGGTLKVDKGEIQSPKFPQSYEFNKLCNWRIIVKEVFMCIIRLSFLM